MLRRVSKRFTVGADFVTAVLDGMAAPASIYADPPDYAALSPPRDVAQSIAAVGRTISGAVGKLGGNGKPADST